MKKVMVDPFIGLVSNSSIIFKHVITKREFMTMLIQYLLEAKKALHFNSINHKTCIFDSSGGWQFTNLE
jgi:hypothetical protein